MGKSHTGCKFEFFAGKSNWQKKHRAYLSQVIQSIYRKNQPYMMAVSFLRTIRGPPESAGFP